MEKHGRKRIRRYRKIKEKLTVEELVISLPPSCFTQMAKIYQNNDSKDFTHKSRDTNS